MMKHIRMKHICMAAAAAALGWGGPVTAQDAAAGDWIELRLGRLAEGPVLGGARVGVGQGFMYLTGGTEPAVPSVGLALGTQLTGRWSARFVMEHAPAADVTGQWHCGPFAVCELALLLPVEGRHESWGVGWDVGYAPELKLGPLYPSVFGGVGLRLRRVRWHLSDGQGGAGSVVEDQASHVMGRLGTGLSARWGRAELFGEVEGVLSRAPAARDALPGGEVAQGGVADLGVALALGARWRVW